MNIYELHQSNKEVSALGLFKGEVGTATAIQLAKNAVLKEHTSKTPALLLCVVGLVTYEDESEQKISLESGDFVLIEPKVKHWLNAAETSQLVLMK